MESLIKIQVVNKSIIEKGHVNFKKSPKERLTPAYISTRLETLEDQWKEFSQTHRNIVGHASETDLISNTYFTNELYDKTEEAYITYKSELREHTHNLKGTSSNHNTDTSSKVVSNVRLPKITLPTFSGLYTEWASFRDLFSSLIDGNGSLDEVQKLHYLKGHLTGEAEQLLRHTPVTASNYEECWSILVKRYNNKRYLANCMFKRFVTQPNIAKESSSNIKSLLDNTVDFLHGLHNLGINVKSWDTMIVYLVCEKLDSESRKLWETRVSACDDLPTFEEFKTFLESRFRSLEYLDSKSSKSKQQNSVSSFNVTQLTQTSCVLCTGDHKLCYCKQFSKKSCDERREFVRVSKLCFNCLGKNHSVYNCRQKTKCNVCKKKHHTLLHVNTTDSQAESSAKGEVVTAALATTSSTTKSNNAAIDEPICCFGQLDHSHGLLATALVHVESTRIGTATVLRALLDQGSQVSFITEAAVQFLGLHKKSTHTNIHRLGDDEGSSVPSRSMVTFKLQSRLDPDFSLYVDAYVLNKLTTVLPERKIVSVTPPIANVKLADPSFHTPGKIDLLLGTRVVGEVLLEGLVKGPPGTPVAQKTKLGWILSGEIPSSAISRPVCYHTVVQSADVNDLLRKFWELESEPSVPSVILTKEEQKCEDFYSKTTKRDATGRYVVKLPFKTDSPSCTFGGSEVIARRRFINLEKRLLKEPELRLQYSAVINEYIQLGHAEVVPQLELGKDAFYLPHHAVVREDKSTTKVRVVFDASCSGHNGISLNKELMVGPTLQPDLRQTVMRWRCHPISLIADIVKMYRQVKVADEDTDYQRIFWRDNPNAELKHIRLLRVTFGTSSAPYLAVRSLQQLARDEGSEFPLVAERVLDSFYVDDLLTGCESVAEGELMYQQLNQLLARGGFKLQKWSSSSDELLGKMNEDTARQDNLELKTDTLTKILGLTYQRKLDEFRYTVQLPTPETPITKRKVISDIARLFDPLGWLAPVIVTAKVFIQRLWLAGIEWDDELPDHLLKEWLSFRNNLNHLRDFRLPRWIHTSQLDVLLELHGFSDASNVAYAAAVYVRCIDANGRVHVSLVAAKTKVAPVKQVSIPRLELCGALLLSKLLREVSDTLGICKENLHAWTDSTVVLAWLSSHPSRWKTFVGNRVSEILNVMDNSQWSHVQSMDNPADCASRGVNPSECANLEMWTQGPSWLKNKEINYSRREIKETNLEERKSVVACTAALKEISENSIISKFSSLRKLTRVVAYCKRFLKFKNKNYTTKFDKFLTHSEIQGALLTCIKLCQGEHFGAEIDSLNIRGELIKKGVLTSLNPYLDQEQILRVGGRLHRANLHEDSKHPIILPRSSHLTHLLIANAHESTLHGGPQLVLNYIRSKYWIINAKSIVRQYVRKCVICIRHSARSIHPLMGSLPSARVTASRPFLRSGVDYAGPINIRPTKGRGYRSTKGYICVFVCMATRAIHLEVVSDMTSQAFLAAFKRFTARRGHCGEMWSDNGTTFVGANKELKVLFNHERSGMANDIANWMATNGTTWSFIPPHSPNFGGLWEAGVKSTKHHLKRVIGTSTLTFEELTTVLAQIEACLNSRPISALSTNPEDPCPLTPGHFLVGEPLLLVPEINFENTNIGTLRRWQLTQRMVQDFWRRWSREYLVQFHQRYKWAHQTIEPNLGDVVLVMEDDLPPSRWLYGLITEKHTGSDKITRVVTLRCKGVMIKRSVSKLIILPVTS